jgi:hypothetical protein
LASVITPTKMVSKLFGRLDLRLYWWAAATAAIYITFVAESSDSLAWPVIACLGVGGVGLWVGEYRWTSTLSIVSLAHIVQFPVAVVLAASLPYPSLAIEPQLWALAAPTLWAMFVGMVALVAGALVGRVLALGRSQPRRIESKRQTPFWFNFALVLLSVPAIIFSIASGSYYQIIVNADYNYAAAESYGFVGYLVYASFVGCVLQIRRYSISGRTIDLIRSGFLVALIFAMNAPSGSRRNGMIGLAIAGLYFLDCGSIPRRVRMVALVVGLAWAVVLIPRLELYRVYGGQRAGAVEQLVSLSAYSLFGESSETPVLDSYVSRAILARRLGDWPSLGFLLRTFPETESYIGFEDLVEWPWFVVPTLARPATNVSHLYDAHLMRDLGFRPDTGGSSPASLMGDLYARGGWSSLSIGMFLFGIVLTRLDKYFSRGTMVSLVIWVLLMDSITMYHMFNPLRIFITLTKQLLIFYVMALFIQAALSFNVRRKYELT